MIKKTLCFNNPAYLSLRDSQLVIKLPEIEKADNLTEDFKKATEVTRPIEDIGVVVLRINQIPQASHSRWFYHVSVFHLRAPLCQHGECRGSSQTCESHLARIREGWHYVHH